MQDMMLCGGSDAVIIPIGIFSSSSAFIFILFSTKAINFMWKTIGAGLGGFVACRALSQRNSDPAKASRPWDIVIFNVPWSFISIPFLHHCLGYGKKISEAPVWNMNRQSVLRIRIWCVVYAIFYFVLFCFSPLIFLDTYILVHSAQTSDLDLSMN